MTKVSRETVLKVAQLSALELSEDEIATMQKKMESILQYVAQLEKVDTKNTGELELVDRPGFDRDDSVHAQFSVEKVLENAPEKGRQCFKIPQVL